MRWKGLLLCTVLLLQMFLIQNNSYGAIFSEVNINVIGTTEGDIAWGDFDNDGDLDIAVTGKYGPDTVAKIYQNLGDNNFFDIGAGLEQVRMSSLVWGDFNNDGYLDIIVTGENDSDINTAKLYINNNGVSFTEKINTELVGVMNCDVEAGDFNNDGFLDVAIVGRDESNVRTANIYINDGTGTFTNLNAGLTGVNNANLALGDYNNDGYLDIIVTGDDSILTPSTSIYSNRGNNTFINVNTTVTDIFTGKVAWGDYDNDNFLDIAIGGRLPGNAYGFFVYHNNGGIDFTKTGATFPAFVYPGVSWGDYDNDGDLDLAIFGRIPPTDTYTKIYRNDGGGTFTDILEDLKGFYDGDLVWGDYDNDGDLDLLISATHEGGAKTVLYRNDLGGSFSDIGAGLSAAEYACLSWGDYDNDGYIDLFVSGEAGVPKNSRLYKNYGGTNFTEIGTIIEDISYGSADWGDFNNDGYLDLALCGIPASGAETAVYSNNGNGTFTEITNGLKKYTYSDIEWGDFDSDGDLDLIVIGSVGSTRTTTIYEYIPGVGFSDMGISFTGVKNGTVAPADYDNDGDLDVFISGGASSGAVSIIYRNDGNGNFTDINAGITAVGSGSADWGDFDNDGDLDLVMAGNSWDRISKVYRNNGGDIFTDINAGLVGIELGSIEWGDYNNDGYLDISVVGYSGLSGYINRIYENHNGEYFADTQAGMTGVRYADGEFGDYNNDGFLDLAVVGVDSSGVRHCIIYKNKLSGITKNSLPNDVCYISCVSNMGETVPGNGKYQFSFKIHDDESDKAIITKIQYSIDNRKWENADIETTLDNLDTSPGGNKYTFIWNASVISENLLAGERIRLKIFTSSYFGRSSTASINSAGLMQYGSTVYQVSFNMNINGYPQCSITSPVSVNSPYNQVTGNIGIYGYAYDDDFSEYIIYYTDGTNTATSSEWIALYTNTVKAIPIEKLCDLDTSLLTNGIYSLKVIVKDKSGKTRDSWTNILNRVRIEVVNVNPLASAVEFTYPTNSQQKVALNSPVVIRFSDKINQNTITPTSVRVYDGSIFIDGLISYNDFSQCLIFTPDDRLDSYKDYIVTVDSSIQNIYGIPMGAEYNFIFKTTSLFPEKVASVYPPYSQPDVGLQSDIKIYYRDGTLSGSEFTNGIEINPIIKTPAPVYNYTEYINSGFMAKYTNTTSMTDKMLYIVTLKPEILDVNGYYTWYFITEDIVDPYVQSTSPSSNGEVGLSGSISAVFNKAMNGNSFTSNSLYMVNLADTNTKISGNIEYLLNDKKVVFTPDNSLILSNSYRVRLTTDIKDFGGKPLSSDYQWNIHTPAYLGTPTNISPENGDESVDINGVIFADFETGLDPATINGATYKLFRGASLQGAQVSYDAAKNRAILTPSASLAPETYYMVFISSNITSTNDRRMVTNYRWNFKTAKTIGPDGGKTGNNKIELIIPPHALNSDTSVQIKKIIGVDIPTVTAANLNIISNSVYRLEPANTVIKKPITINISYSHSDITDKNELNLAIFLYKNGNWTRIGGTVNEMNNTLSVVIKEFGILAIMEDLNTYTGELEAVEIECQPRVFNPNMWGKTALSFKLNKPLQYSVRVCDISGNLVKDVVTEVKGQPGQNVVLWDGRDARGNIVPDKLYIIYIRLDDGDKKITRTKTVSILKK